MALILHLDDPAAALVEAKRIIPEIDDPLDRYGASVALLPHLDLVEAEGIIEGKLPGSLERVQAWVALLPHHDPAEAQRIIRNRFIDPQDSAVAWMAASPAPRRSDRPRRIPASRLRRDHQPVS